MLKLAIAALVLSAVLSAYAADKPVVLKGLDPVALVKGRETKGKADLYVEYGRFRYLFASAEDMKLFEASPDKYAVQHDGTCLMHPGMIGDPDLYLVEDSKIYLTGSENCLKMVKPQVALAVKELDERKKVAIMIFPGVQIIDYTGPYEVLGGEGYEVYTVAAKPDPLLTNMGMTVTPAYTFDNCPKPDILVLPGGNVPQEAEKDNPQVAFVKRMVPETQYTMSVCNGAFWLANAGLLDGKQGTTFYGMLDDLKAKYPKVDVVRDKKFVDNGQIVCTAGLSSGIEGALHMIEKLEGPGEAKAVALNLEYNWQPDSGFARGAFADMNLRKAIGRKGFDLPDNTDVKVLDVKGDRDQWEKSWQLTNADATQQSLADRIQKQLSASWTLVSSKSNGEEAQTWTFKDEQGRAWSATTVVQPDASAKGKFVMTVRLWRDASSK